LIDVRDLITLSPVIGKVIASFDRLVITFIDDAGILHHQVGRRLKVYVVTAQNVRKDFMKQQPTV
jgi:hypothetical protein